jgi:hypothetical protein
MSVHDSYLGAVEVHGLDMVPEIEAQLPPVRHEEQGDCLLVSIIPEHELPQNCDPVLEHCGIPAAVYVTSSSGYVRRPLCHGHAHVVFAEWMVAA